MPKITFIHKDGSRRVLDGQTGQTVMQLATAHGIPEIDADCGGACACATCHVYVEGDWLARTGEKSDMESSMLGFAAVTQDNSRLSCQITVTAELEGLVVSLPEGQH